MSSLIRNSVSYVGVFVLTLAGYIYGVSYWRQAFLIGRNFDSVPMMLALIWGFDFLLPLIAGFVLFLLVRANRPFVWTTALGLGFVLMRMRFTKDWISPDADWTIYLEDYVLYVVPLLGTLGGGSLANWIQSRQHSRSGALTIVGGVRERPLCPRRGR